MKIKLIFIISSDVFEHIPPPTSKAFSNLYKILRPCGIVILTVPYKSFGETIEHFPNLFNYEILVKKRKEEIEKYNY